MEYWSDGVWGRGVRQHSITPTLQHALRRSAGFTMLELMVALTVMLVAFTIIWTTFSTTLKAWRRGDQLVDELHHGDFVMEQLVSALRSTAYFVNRPEKYGFWLDNHGDEDEISWVTSGSAFMPPGSPFVQGLHRIWISVEDNDDGDEAFAVRAFPPLKKEIDKHDVDPWFISSRIKGINCRTWNAEDEDWEDEWEDTNKIPGLIEITLYMEPLEKYGEPVKISRLVELPLGPAVTSITAAVNNQTGQPGAQPTGGQPAEGQPAQGGAGAGAGAGAGTGAGEIKNGGEGSAPSP